MSLFRCVLAAGATILGLALGFAALADEAAKPIGKDVGTLRCSTPTFTTRRRPGGPIHRRPFSN